MEIIRMSKFLYLRISKMEKNILRGIYEQAAYP